MAEYNSPSMHSNLNDQQFRLNKINEVRDYFIGEIRERELMSKRLSKYIASFYYSDKCLSDTSGSISPVGIASANFSLAFSISTGTVIKLLKTTRNKEEIG